MEASAVTSSLAAPSVVDVGAVAAMAKARSVRLFGHELKVVLPRRGDPRLHVAAVIVSVQVLGQVVLGFDVSLAQIFIAVGTAAMIELVMVAWTRRELAWPASALLTGNGVALLLRVPGTEHGDWWSVRGWPIFVAASGVSLLAKYAIRVGGRQVFNPSNFGLVVVFLLFGSQRADPQDLWWGPWSVSLAVTFAVIVIGGLTLARRLHLFSVAVGFWATFAVSTAVLAASGHAISARWHLGPVDGGLYWTTIVFSPEILIFVFFMITDPRTMPAGRVGRVTFAMLVGVLASVFAALQTTEFATKVALLLALVLACLARPLLDRWLPDERFTGDHSGSHWWRPWSGGTEPVLVPTLRGVVALMVLVGCLLGSVWGLGGIGSSSTGPSIGATPRGEAPQIALPVNAVPTVTVDDALRAISGALRPGDVQRMGQEVVEALWVEGEAVRSGDASALSSVAFGRERRRAERAVAAAPRGPDDIVRVERFDVTELEVVLLKDRSNPQSTPQLGLAASGWRRWAGFIEDGTIEVVLDGRDPLSMIFLVTEVEGRFLVGDRLPGDSPMRVGT